MLMGLLASVGSTRRAPTSTHLARRYTSAPPAVKPVVAPANAVQVDPAIKAIQHKLNQLHIAVLAEDGVNGPKTKATVQLFEKIEGLAVDTGIWGSQCNAAYAAIIAKPTLKFASHGQVVKYLQWRLELNPDGIFGFKTLSYVKAFQGKNGLKKDGIIGPASWQKLIG